MLMAQRAEFAMPEITDTRVALVFTEDAVFAAGVPVNFRDAVLRMPPLPLGLVR
jgi:hypothetical protein